MVVKTIPRMLAMESRIPARHGEGKKITPSKWE